MLAHDWGLLWLPDEENYIVTDLNQLYHFLDLLQSNCEWIFPGFYHVFKSIETTWYSMHVQNGDNLFIFNQRSTAAGWIIQDIRLPTNNCLAICTINHEIKLENICFRVSKGGRNDIIIKSLYVMDCTLLSLCQSVIGSWYKCHPFNVRGKILKLVQHCAEIKYR